MVWVPELGLWATAVVVIGEAFVCIVLIVAILGWLIQILNHIPGVNIGTGWLHTVQQTLTHGLGVAFHELDGLVGKSFHLAANIFDWMWRETKGHVVLISLIAAEAELIAHAVSGLHSHVNRLSKTHEGTAARVKTLEREYHGIEHELKKIEHDISKGIGADVLPRIKTLEREVATVESQTIPAIESAEHANTDSLTKLWDWVKRNVAIPGTATFAGAVAIALGALGLGGLSCSNFKNLLGKWKCGLGTLLDDLIGIAIAGLVLESVCEFLPLIEDAFGAIAGPLTHLLNEVPLGACETPPSGWAQLSVAAGPLPPAQSLGTLPT